MKTFWGYSIIAIMFAVGGTLMVNASEDRILENMENARAGEHITVIEYTKTEVINDTIEPTIVSEFVMDVYSYRDEIREYYYYNISNIGKAMSRERLKELGGVCHHYALWYCELAREDGYSCKAQRINSRSWNAHEYARIWTWDLSEYCIADQTKIVGCMELNV